MDQQEEIMMDGQVKFQREDDTFILSSDGVSERFSIKCLDFFKHIDRY